MVLHAEVRFGWVGNVNVTRIKECLSLNPHLSLMFLSNLGCGICDLPLSKQ